MGVVKKQGINNTLLVYTGTVIGFVSLLFIQPVFLSKEELGLTRMILGFAAVMSILFSFGISAVTIKYLPKTFDKDHKHRGFFGFVIIYTTISVVVGLIFLYAVKSLIFRFYANGSQAFIEHFNFVILLTIINAYILGLNSYCIALLKTTFTTFLNDVLSKILFIVIIFLHFFGYLHLEQFLFAFCMTYGITCILLIVNIFFIDRPGFVPDSKYIEENIGYRPIIRYGIIITVTAMNSVGLKYLDTLFVGAISLGHAGIYSVAAFIGLMIEIPLNALERIANPSIAHAMASKNINEIKNNRTSVLEKMLLNFDNVPVLFEDEGRTITAEFDNFFLVTSYFPNCGMDIRKLYLRTELWDTQFQLYLQSLNKKKPVILTGDLNVVPQDIDINTVNSKYKNDEEYLCTRKLRVCHKNLLNNSFKDAFRYFYPSKY